jgi:hypothetical protein
MLLIADVGVEANEGACSAVSSGCREEQERRGICINGVCHLRVTVGRVRVAVIARESRFDAIPWSARARAHQPLVNIMKYAPGSSYILHLKCYKRRRGFWSYGNKCAIGMLYREKVKLCIISGSFKI